MHDAVAVAAVTARCHPAQCLTPFAATGLHESHQEILNRVSRAWDADSAAEGVAASGDNAEDMDKLHELWSKPTGAQEPIAEESPKGAFQSGEGVRVRWGLSVCNCFCAVVSTSFSTKPKDNARENALLQGPVAVGCLDQLL